MIKKLLNLTNEIINLCNSSLETKSSPNIGVIRIIKNEFEVQRNSLIKEEKVTVLNNRCDLWASRTITDSAYFEYDKCLFDKVFEFAELCKKLNKNDLIVLYK